MTDLDASAPLFDVRVPHIARIYDYWLGGKDNFQADREAAELAIAANPTIVPGVRANRRFLGRAVRYLADQGVTQFLDVGTGIPAANNTHEVAQSVVEGSRVVYVDNDRCKSGCAHSGAWSARRKRCEPLRGRQPSKRCHRLRVAAGRLTGRRGIGSSIRAKTAEIGRFTQALQISALP